MIRFEIIWSDLARDQFRKLDQTVRRRIAAKVEEAATDPFRVARRLVGSPYHRIRVGDWRVVIEIDQGAIRIIVIDVKHRRTASR